MTEVIPQRREQSVQPIITIWALERKFLTPTNLRPDLNLLPQAKRRVPISEDKFDLKRQLRAVNQKAEHLPKLEINCKTEETKESEEESVTTPRKNKPIFKRAVLKHNLIPEDQKNQRLERCLNTVLLDTVSIKDREALKFKNIMDHSKNSDRRIQFKCLTKPEKSSPNAINAQIALDNHLNDVNASYDTDQDLDIANAGVLYTIEGAFLLDDEDGHKTIKHKQKLGSTLLGASPTKSVEKTSQKIPRNLPVITTVSYNKQGSGLSTTTEGDQSEHRKQKPNLRYSKDKTPKELKSSLKDSINFEIGLRDSQASNFLKDSIIIHSTAKCKNIFKPTESPEKADPLTIKTKDGKQRISKEMNRELYKLLSSVSASKPKISSDHKPEAASYQQSDNSLYNSTSHKINNSQTLRNSDQKAVRKSIKIISKQPKKVANSNMVEQYQMDWIQDWVKVSRPSNEKILSSKNITEKPIMSLPASSKQDLISSCQHDVLQRKYFAARQFFVPSPIAKNKL